MKLLWKSQFRPGDRIKVVKASHNSVTTAKVGEVYTLRSQTPNDRKLKLWTTEELGFWCVSEFNIKKMKEK